MGILIDGKQIAQELNAATKVMVEQLQKTHQLTPGLVVIIVGEDKASQRYVRSKHKMALKLGINSVVEELPETTTQAELLAVIDQYNQDDQIHGILVQAPLPTHIDELAIFNHISPQKDVDGFNPVNVGKLYLNQQGNYPVACTPKGIMSMFAYYNIELTGKKVAMIGRSAIVGKPMTALLLNQGATVSILHSKTPDISEYTKSADIIISATGRLHMVTEKDVKPGAVIIDVGQNLDENNKLVGDVDFDDLLSTSSYITPVPGGVGPMTIATLMRQSVELAKWSNNIE